MKQLFASILLLAAAVFADPPAAPADLSGYLSRNYPYQDSLILRWSSVANANEYRVLRALTSSGQFEVVATTDTGFFGDTTFFSHGFYQVQAGNADGWSEPSNTAGYVKIVIFDASQYSTYTPFGIPFQTWDVPFGGSPSYGVPSTCPSDIIGYQTTCGSLITADRVIRQDNGQFAYRYWNSCDAWASLLEYDCGMVPGRAFWLKKVGYPIGQVLILAGAVNDSGGYADIAMAESGHTPCSWRATRNLPFDSLSLITAGFRGGTLLTSDRVIEQLSGEFAWYRQTNEHWDGMLHEVTPGHAYWIQNKDHDNDDWVYNYVPGNP